MAVTLDMLATYRRPRAVVGRLLQAGAREDRALVFVMLACGLIFVGQWPKLARQAHLDPSVPLDARLGGSLLAWMVIAPLLLYFLAWLLHLGARVFGSKASAFATRIAIFWSLLAAAPLWMFHGLTEGFLGQGPTTSLVGAVVLGVTLVFCVQGMRAAAQSAIAPTRNPS